MAKREHSKLVNPPVDQGQVSRSAAQVYDDFFVPALFEQWPARVCDAAQIKPGHRVLDVACGTGVLAKVAANLAGSEGFVVGLDINEGMLDVARRKAPKIEWRYGEAEALPFPGESFNAVVSQFGLMFFMEPITALQEMYRVLRPGGRMVVAVWNALANSPGYTALAVLLDRLFGAWAADVLRAPFALGDRRRLQELFAQAQIPSFHITTHPGRARFPSIASWISTEIKGWTLADQIGDAQYERLLREAQQVLRPFQMRDGSVAFDAPARLIMASKRTPYQPIIPLI